MLGFTSGIGKIASIDKLAIKKRILEFLGKTVGGYAKKNLLPVLGEAAGWTLGSNIFKNLSDGDEISPSKLSDDFMNNVAMFGGFKLLGSGLSASSGGISKGLGAVAKRLGYVAGKVPSAAAQASKAAVKMRASARKMLSSPMGREIAKQKIKMRKLWNKEGWTAIGAGVGAYAGYDPDNPISSTISGGVKGGLYGKILGGAAGKRSVKPLAESYGAKPMKLPDKSWLGEITSQIKPNIKGGIAMGALGDALQKKQKRQQDKQIKQYYEQLRKSQQQQQSYGMKR